MAAFQKGQKAGPGRPKGMQDKITRDVKDMILAALESAGGVQYLADRAIDTPGPFLALVGKVLPLQIAGAGADGRLIVEIVRFAANPVT